MVLLPVVKTHSPRQIGFDSKRFAIDKVAPSSNGLPYEKTKARSIK
jgi:hypothetical protein